MSVRSGRLLRSELRLVFGHRRNQLLLVVTVAGGDSMAGEAGYGTLRYLLTVPAGRTRLLAVKLAATVIFALSATVIVSAVALAAGAAVFPVGPVTLLSGATVSLAAGLVRLLLVTLYVVAAMATLGALALAVSTLPEHSLAAIAAVVIAVVTSEVLDNIPQLGWLAPYLPTHWWLSFDALLRAPADTVTVEKGLASFGIYLAMTVAWAAGLLILGSRAASGPGGRRGGGADWGEACWGDFGDEVEPAISVAGGEPSAGCLQPGGEVGQAAAAAITCR